MLLACVMADAARLDGGRPTKTPGTSEPMQPAYRDRLIGWAWPPWFSRRKYQLLQYQTRRDEQV